MFYNDPVFLMSCLGSLIFTFLQRRQRRLVEQHQNQQGGGVIGNEIKPKGLPQLVPVNGSSIHTGSTFGATKSIYSSTNLPKVHLPHHHRHQTNAANLLPGILKTNMLQPKTFPKTKIKVIKKVNNIQVNFNVLCM